MNKRFIKVLTASILFISMCLLSVSCGRVSVRNGPDEPGPENADSTTKSNTVVVTFPEGYTVREIAARLEENEVCSASDFIDEANNASYIEEYGFAIENPGDRPYLLEGYIFPDTYEFYRNENPSSVIKRFLRNTSSKLDGIRQKAEELGYTTDEIITFASIVQKESGGSDEAGRVASVLHNRMNSPSFPQLQCDACSIYLKTYVKPYTESGRYDEYCELYNTYMCKGLPAGAICNPGMKSINAVLDCEDTPYYFFVTDSENNYLYAETWEQHQQNCKAAGIG